MLSPEAVAKMERLAQKDRRFSVGFRIRDLCFMGVFEVPLTD